MVATAEKRAKTELRHRGGQGIPESRQPVPAARAGRDVRLFDDLAEGSEIGKQVCGCGQGNADCQAPPGPPGQRRQRRRSTQLLEQTQKPIRRRPIKQPVIQISRPIIREGIRSIGGLEVVGPGRQTGAMGRQIQQVDFPPGGPGNGSWRQQTAHGFIQSHLLLHNHLCEQKAGKRLADRSDLEDRSGLRGSIGEDPPDPVMNHANNHARSGSWRQRAAPRPTRWRQVAVQDGFEFVRIDGRQRCAISKDRGRLSHGLRMENGGPGDPGDGV